MQPITSLPSLFNFIGNKISKVVNLGLIGRPHYNYVLFYKGDISVLPPTSVIIPIVEKNLSILALNLVNLRKYCPNPIIEIFVVSTASEKISKECEILNITWVDEVTVAPMSEESIHELLGESFRANWFYQQFMKLNFNTLADTLQYLVLDADTILLSHQYFADQNHMILKLSDEYHYLYQFTNGNLVPGLKFRYRSFISRHQLISKDILQELKKHILYDEKLLWQRILFTIQNNKNWFSEYELYGSFASQQGISFSICFLYLCNIFILY